MQAGTVGETEKPPRSLIAGTAWTMLCPDLNSENQAIVIAVRILEMALQ